MPAAQSYYYLSACRDCSMWMDMQTAANVANQKNMRKPEDPSCSVALYNGFAIAIPVNIVIHIHRNWSYICNASWSDE